MPAIEIKLTKSLFNTVRDLARKDSVSVSQFIEIAVREKVAKLLDEEETIRRSEQSARDKAKARDDSFAEE